MIKRLQLLPPGVRIVVFVFIVVGVLLLLAGFTLLLLMLTVNSTTRQTAISLVETVAVSEYAALPDDDAYPSTVAAGADGMVYTASYASGTVWQVAPDGSMTEIPDTRETFDSVTGLVARPDNTLLAIAFTGGEEGAWGIHSITADGHITPFGTLPDERGFVSPFDITIDSDGGVYVVDRSRAEVWRWESTGGEGTLWWSLATPPANAAFELPPPAPTGITYEAARDAILVADPDANTIVRIPRTGGASHIVLQYIITAGSTFPPGFDGIAAAPDGSIYVTALDQKGVIRVDSDGEPFADEMAYIAGNFRGPSDLALLPDGRLIVANFDSVSLVQPGVAPQLPFALDVITFADAE